MSSTARSSSLQLLRRGLVVVLLLALLATVGVAWYFADQLTVPPTFGPWDRDTVVLDVRGDVLDLPAEGFAAQAGRWGLELPDDGHVVLVEQVALTDEVASWRFEDAQGDGPTPDDPARVDEYAYQGDPSVLGLPFEEIAVDGPLGDLPAWWVPGDGEPDGTVVFVHGHSATRQESLRFLGPIVGAGWNVLVLSYRGDDGAPALVDDRVRFGTQEWEDVDAAIAYVDARSPGPLVLFGSSMGGAMVAQTLDRSPLAETVDGVVLDSPLLSMDVLLGLQAELNGIPSWAAPVVLPVVQLIADVRFGMDSSGLEQTEDDGTFDVPVLLFHGDDDGYVPFESSEEFAEASAQVTWVRVLDAGHVRSWNIDPEAYDAALVAFLDQVVDA